jgi:hypothetical protein
MVVSIVDNFRAHKKMTRKSIVIWALLIGALVYRESTFDPTLLYTIHAAQVMLDHEMQNTNVRTHHCIIRLGVCVNCHKCSIEVSDSNTGVLWFLSIPPRHIC